MKRILAFILTLIIVISSVSVLATAQAVSGDVNGDNSLDIVDVAIVRGYIVGTFELGENEKIVADMNTDNEVDIIDIAMMRSIIVNGDIITDTEEDTASDTEIVTDTETDIISDTDTASDTDTEENTTSDNDYDFLEVSDERIEQAYRSLIEHNTKGTTPTEEDLRIVSEDCVKYVLNTDNEIFKTWTYTPTLNCDNGGYYTGAGASNTALQAWSAEQQAWVWVYEYDLEYKKIAYEQYRNECHRLAIDFIEIQQGEYGGGYEYCRFNFDINYQGFSYVVNFIYG